MKQREICMGIPALIFYFCLLFPSFSLHYFHSYIAVRKGKNHPEDVVTELVPVKGRSSVVELLVSTVRVPGLSPTKSWCTVGGLHFQFAYS